ncbi:hypothetical protein CEXT_747241 [Caerostris extrusa]|uniref:Uncharacterized protein n=1 Tax=Caerostris extrusa TaxID=172846 RepID=A0AAV4XMK6_CAEEX|nr:hypothetical protein CEXT_747241 [Caerostris extrusa]
MDRSCNLTDVRRQMVFVARACPTVFNWRSSSIADIGRGTPEDFFHLPRDHPIMKHESQEDFLERSNAVEITIRKCVITSPQSEKHQKKKLKLRKLK